MVVEKVINDEQVKNFFMYALSQPPATAGLRLRSEEELASLVGIGRWRIRVALQNLLANGILVKRRGSGAYIRKVPTAPEGITSDHFTDFEKISPKDIFAFDTKIERLRPTSSQKKLNLTVCAHVYVSSPSQQAILGGMVGRANALGHGISLITFVDQYEEMLPLEERRERLASNPCDGYLVMEGWINEFREAVPFKNVPVLLAAHSSWKHVARYGPKIAIDNLDAIRQGLDILAEEGYRKIAMIGVDAYDHPEQEEARVYHETLLRYGLEYRSINNLPFSLSEIINSVKKIFSRPDRPEAIYVNDDYIMVGVAEALEMLGLKPGRDVGVITLSTTHHHLPKHAMWSKMEFNLRQYGEVLVDNLLRMIETTDHRMSNILFQACWVPGQTHLKPK